jgi:hypothetical protein
VHYEVQTGFSITLADEELALGSAEGKAIVNVERPPAFLEWRLKTGGTAPSDGNDDLSIWRSGN